MKDIISNSEKQILEILENSYIGAKMSDDEEMMLRCSRAIFAFKADICKDIFKEEAVESQIEDEINNTLKKRGIIK